MVKPSSSIPSPWLQHQRQPQNKPLLLVSPGTWDLGCNVCTGVGVQLHMGPRVTCPSVCPQCCPAAVGSLFACPLSLGQHCGGQQQDII